MKVLIIRNYPSYVDVNNSTYNLQELGLARALTRRGIQCDVLYWTNHEEKTVYVSAGEAGTVSVIYKKGIAKLKNVIYTKCEELFEKYDILQPSEYNQIQSWHLAKKYPHKTVIYHGPYYSPFNKRYNLMCTAFDKVLLKRYLMLGTKFIVKSRLAEDFLAGKNILPENVKFIGVGVDPQMLSSSAGEKENLFAKNMISSDSPLKLLYVGRFERRRNIPFIFDVFKQLLAVEPGAELYMIGTGNLTEVNQYFEYAKQIGVYSKIIWQDKMLQRDLSQVYSASDFFILPTEYEIFGMVLMEAMYYENVVVTNYNGGSSALIQNNVNGIIVEEKDAVKWADKILQLNSDKQTMERMKVLASRKIKEEFTWDALADGFIEQYRKRMEG